MTTAVSRSQKSAARGPEDWARPLQSLIENARQDASSGVGHVTTDRKFRAVIVAPKSANCRSLRLRFEQRELNRGGRWGRWKEFLADPTGLGHFSPQIDQTIAELIARNDATIKKPEVRYEYSWHDGNIHH